MEKFRSKYFTSFELTYSSTASRLKIDNTPNEEQCEHLKELMAVLDTIREGWGGPLHVNSGFRCEKLNQAVGGSKTSVHKIGFACDLYPWNNRFAAFVEYMKKWAETHDFDQLLIERNSRGGVWIHVGLFSNSGKQRHQIKNMNVK